MKQIKSLIKVHKMEQSFINIVMIMILLDISNSGTGYLIAPVKSEQNQTKVFDKDKLQTNQSFSHPNSISSDSNLLRQSDDNFIDPFINKTYFRTANLSIITSQVGSIVQVPCSVHLIGDEMVSWIRKKDYHLLTVGLTTYSSDERFSAVHYTDSEDWQLKIKYVQLRDAGTYECQISTHPPTSIYISLNVVESKAEINGPAEKYLKPGSMLRLTCRVLENIENPLFLFWYHNSRMINYDSHRGINVSIEQDNKYSELLILQTTTNHSGNYSCVPNNAAPASTFVHIFNGENPAAMQHGDTACSANLSPYIKTLFLLIATYQFVYKNHIT